MNKEQILKTLDTKVSDGTVTEILREIVNSIPEGGGNEPLIVEGEVNGASFTTTDPTIFDTAYVAFNSGKDVLIKFTIDSYEYISRVFLGGYTPGEEDTLWAHGFSDTNPSMIMWQRQI